MDRCYKKFCNGCPYDDGTDEECEHEVENYACGNCKWFHHGEPCKRLDHDRVKFHRFPFGSYDQHQHGGIICSDFEPASWCVHACEVWPGFDAWFDCYQRTWKGGQDLEKQLMFFNLGGDESIDYGVPLLDFVYGNMYEDGKLKCVCKERTVRDKIDLGVQLYKIVREPCDPVPIPEKEENENATL